MIEETCKKKNCKLIVSEPFKAEIIDDTIFGTEFVFDENTYKTQLTGNHQIENTVNN